MRRFLLIPAYGLVLFTLAACSINPFRQSAPSPTAAQITVQATTADPTLSPAGKATSAPTAASGSDPAAPPAGSTGSQPVEIKGTFSFTNKIILTYYVEHAVALNDMYGFVKRDKEWQLPIDSQVLGYMKIDTEKKTGEFFVDLPMQPAGKQVDVNPDGKDGKGVQVFAATYSPNTSGGPFSEGDDASRGWPSYLASVKTDSEKNDEVTGGKLLIWAPDGQQQFPSGFGADGLLFTQDDPVMPVQQGYSVIDLDQKPFQIIRDSTAEMTLYEPAESALKDYSKLSYMESFDKMFELVRQDYAFNGIEGKQPDWDKVYADVAPKIEAAQQAKDPVAYYKALRDFTRAFKDGHVNLSGGDAAKQVFSEEFGGGYGFAVRQLDDGRVETVHVVAGGPAEKAGMKVGAVISQFNGKPVDEAIREVQPPTAPTSMESTLRYEQATYLVRAPLGTKAKVTFTNPGGSAQTAELNTVGEQESLYVTSPYRNYDPNALPVEYVVASSSVGYIRVNSNYDDLNLILRLFQRALDKFKENKITTLIIDLRVNSGGAPLGLAGFLTNQEIPLGQLEYYNSQTGKFAPEGDERKIYPNQEQYHFDKMFLLVGQACASACELESYGFSQVPGMKVIGETPTSGTEAEVSRGQFQMPEGIKMQVPFGRFVLPDGSIFLEGKGVQPTDRVPVTEETVLSDRDPVIQKVFQLASQ